MLFIVFFGTLSFPIETADQHRVLTDYGTTFTFTCTVSVTSGLLVQVRVVTSAWTPTCLYLATATNHCRCPAATSTTRCRDRRGRRRSTTPAWTSCSTTWMKCWTRLRQQTRWTPTRCSSRRRPSVITTCRLRHETPGSTVPPPANSQLNSTNHIAQHVVVYPLTLAQCLLTGGDRVGRQGTAIGRVRPLVCLFSSNPHNSTMGIIMHACLHVVHGHSSLGIESQGHKPRSRVKVSMDGNAVSLTSILDRAQFVL